MVPCVCACTHVHATTCGCVCAASCEPHRGSRRRSRRVGHFHGPGRRLCSCLRVARRRAPPPGQQPPVVDVPVPRKDHQVQDLAWAAQPRPLCVCFGRRRQLCTLLHRSCKPMPGACACPCACMCGCVRVACKQRESMPSPPPRPRLRVRPTVGCGTPSLSVRNIRPPVGRTGAGEFAETTKTCRRHTAKTRWRVGRHAPARGRSSCERSGVRPHRLPGHPGGCGPPGPHHDEETRHEAMAGRLTRR